MWTDLGVEEWVALPEKEIKRKLPRALKELLTVFGPEEAGVRQWREDFNQLDDVHLDVAQEPNEPAIENEADDGGFEQGLSAFLVLATNAAICGCAGRCSHNEPVNLDDEKSSTQKSSIQENEPKSDSEDEEAPPSSSAEPVLATPPVPAVASCTDSPPGAASHFGSPPERAATRGQVRLPSECWHTSMSTHGTNQWQKRWTCMDCGLVRIEDTPLNRRRKELAAARNARGSSQGTDPHRFRS